MPKRYTDLTGAQRRVIRILWSPAVPERDPLIMAVTSTKNIIVHSPQHVRTYRSERVSHACETSHACANTRVSVCNASTAHAAGE